MTLLPYLSTRPPRLPAWHRVAWAFLYAGAVLTAGFRFDVPVRFEGDRLEVGRATFLAGEAVSVPLVEIREVTA